MRSIIRAWQKWVCFTLVIFSFFHILPGQAQQIVEGRKRNQIVRVHLTRLGTRNRLDLTFTSPYQLVMENGTKLYFHSGSQVTMQIENEQIYLYYQEMGQQIGTSVSLIRAENAQNEMTGFRVTNFPALYLGDLRIDISNGALRPILSIHVEDYLLGVVPYEMGETFPEEALKAQAIAARTYALRNQGRYKDFDLTDNTNDQVFRGYQYGNARSEAAVKETRGLCGYYKGDLAQCYYSASNGGQTELVQSVWTSREAYSYYTSGEDPYDLENPESVVRYYRLKKVYDESSEAPYAIRQLVAEQFRAALAAQGYKASPDNVRVDRFIDVSVGTPSQEGSKHMTTLHMELEVSIRKQPEITIRTGEKSDEDVSLFTESPEPDSDASTQTTFDPFIAWHEMVSVDLPIFPDAEKAFSLDISTNYDNEIWSVTENEKEFVVEVRRYGHGVGMSQRGAQWMAAQYGKTYLEILDFYYPGMQLIRYPEQPRAFADVDDALAVTAGPAPSPTPLPTLMPVTIEAEKNQWFAVVDRIADGTSLNLRSEPSLNGSILMRLYKGQRLLVLKRCQEEGWVHVKTDAAEGYVLESYLSETNN